MQRKSEESTLLVKASPNSTFDILLKRAEEDGRLGGKFRCMICGMMFQSEGEAITCCEKLKEKRQR